VAYLYSPYEVLRGVEQVMQVVYLGVPGGAGLQKGLYKTYFWINHIEELGGGQELEIVSRVRKACFLCERVCVFKMDAKATQN
jgi:hypothetical protein